MNTFFDDGYGVTLYSKGDSIFLQGDDADYFLKDIEVIDNIWKKRNYKPYTRKHKGVFDSYEEHVSAIISTYF